MIAPKTRVIVQGRALGDLSKMTCTDTHKPVSLCDCFDCLAIRRTKRKQDNDRAYASHYEMLARVKDRNRGFGQGAFAALKDCKVGQ